MNEEMKSIRTEIRAKHLKETATLVIVIKKLTRAGECTPLPVRIITVNFDNGLSGFWNKVTALEDELGFLGDEEMEGIFNAWDSMEEYALAHRDTAQTVTDAHDLCERMDQEDL